MQSVFCIYSLCLQYMYHLIPYIGEKTVSKGLNLQGHEIKRHQSLDVAQYI